MTKKRRGTVDVTTGKKHETVEIDELIMTPEAADKHLVNKLRDKHE